MWTNPSNPRPWGTVVIGLGNPLMGDDGLGLVTLERLRESGGGAGFTGAIDLVDGGTWGLTLLPVIESASRVVLLDAIERGAPPGTLHTLQRDDIPRYFATKISPHQVALQDVLALAELRGTLPRETVAIGIEPARVEMGCGLSEPIARRVDDLVEVVLRHLAAWGHVPQPVALPVHA
jgi:hydrogenase maturation protease